MGIFRIMDANFQSNSNQLLLNLIAAKQKERSYRTLPYLQKGVDFCSNDYLGLGKEMNNSSLPNQRGLYGVSGSRLISGNSIQIEKIEYKIAEFHGASAGLIFNSGYSANIGLITSVVKKGDTVIHDEFIHASIIDGIRLTGASRYKFCHNDIDSLKAIVERKKLSTNGNIFVVIESIYSMDGDFAPLQEISDLCDANQILLVVDEAHATGIVGDMGKGLVSKLNLEDKVLARVITFGKALGLFGAIVLGSELLRQVLINYARTFIYTTALHESVVQEVQFRYDKLNNERICVLDDLIAYFKEKASAMYGLNWKLNDTPIQLLFIENPSEIKSLVHYLIENNIAVKSIGAPTVKKGTERIRFIIHAYNSREEITRLFELIFGFYETYNSDRN